MLAFSNDADILKYESILFTDLYRAGQVLCKGDSAVLDGTILTAQNEDFVSANVSAGGVIYLRDVNGQPEGAYEIVSVNSVSELAVSVLRASSEADPVSAGDSGNLFYRVSTFEPQAAAVLFELTQYFGIRPGDSSARYGLEDVIDTGGLRQASVYAVIANAFATLAGGDTENNSFREKNVYYRGLFEKARQRCRLGIDAGEDGVIDFTAVGGSIKMLRD